MNQNTEQDLKELVHDFAQDVKDGIKIASDVTAIVEAHSITAVLSLLEVDFPSGLADVCKSIADFIRTEHDFLPSAKTKATLSDGEVITEKYYQTDETFKERIARDEEHIKQYGNSGE